jgi:hypothetical protein
LRPPQESHRTTLPTSEDIEHLDRHRREANEHQMQMARDLQYENPIMAYALCINAMQKEINRLDRKACGVPA